MDKKRITYKEFDGLVKIARFQFILKTKKGIYFLPLPNYTSYNENGFVAHSETTGQIEILTFEEIIEITVDSKKYFY
jgi:hypothetical protein